MGNIFECNIGDQGWELQKRVPPWKLHLLHQFLSDMENILRHQNCYLPPSLGSADLVITSYQVHTYLPWSIFVHSPVCRVLPWKLHLLHQFLSDTKSIFMTPKLLPFTIFRKRWFSNYFIPNTHLPALTNICTLPCMYTW